jgi:hypothetical protein
MKNLVQKDKQFRINVKKFLNNSNNKTKKNLKNKIIKKFISYFCKNWGATHILVICTISLFLLVRCSPILSILWVMICTLYLLYIHSYKDISKIWGFTFFMWYIIFTISLSEITIRIGFENTGVIVIYLLDSDVLCKNLCFQTVFLLDALSSKLGVSIYVPGIPNIFKLFAKFLKGPKTNCSGKGEPGGRKPIWFSLGKPKKSQSEVDMSLCEVLAKEIEKKAENVFYSQNSTTDGNRTVIYTKSWLPGFGIRNVCYARDSSKLEKELFKSSKTP